MVSDHFCGLFIWSQMIMLPILMVAHRVSPINLGTTLTPPSALVFLAALADKKTKRRKDKKTERQKTDNKKRVSPINLGTTQTPPSAPVLFSGRRQILHKMIGASKKCSCDKFDLILPPVKLLSNEL